MQKRLLMLLQGLLVLVGLLVVPRILQCLRKSLRMIWKLRMMRHLLRFDTILPRNQDRSRMAALLNL